MNKLIAVAVAVCLAGALAAAPAHAGKKKKVREEFSAEGIPYPVTGSANNGYGCAEGVDGVHKTTVDFTTPGAGRLDVKIGDFAGDWDLHVLDADGEILGQSISDNSGSAEERVIVSLKAGAEIQIVACNWLGGPSASGSYTYVYR